jgi:hypothetical protein
VLDVMENWRDTMQSELPGFRDRVCQIHLAGDEGRLNLEMDADTIKDLTGRGHEAGIEIGRKFSWRRHLFTRYLTLMQMMERGLQDVDRKFDGLDADLAAGMPGIDVYVEGHEPDWCREAERASSDLFLLASRWGSPPAKVGFNRGYEPRPTPAMRVTPKA